jgi:hypothetical protein
LGFVSYDTKGEYRGYSSNEPTFKDNYICYNPKEYLTYLNLPIVKQENILRSTLIKDFDNSKNEFYRQSIFGRLDSFSTWGCATGIMPMLDFAAARQALFDVLKKCDPGTWYSTSSLVTYLKAHHRFFLIPDRVFLNKFNKLPEKRYGNFYEDAYGRTSIPDDALDGFERVEGRYVERFLEGIPLSLGYVEVAYDLTSSQKPPFYGALKAFRINERFLQATQGNILQPKVIVQPNFEIYIDSPFYPSALLHQLAPLTDTLKQDTTTILKLQKQKVATQLAENDRLDIIGLLQGLCEKEIPQNVLVELEEWAGHADVFTLYEGFGLVECQTESAIVDGFTVEKIGNSFHLVREPETLLSRLRESKAVAIHIQHADHHLQLLPEKLQTIFPRKVADTQTKKKKTKQSVTLKRETWISFYFPDDELFEKFRKALIDANCLLDINKEKHTLIILGQYESQVKQIIKQLSSEYIIQVEDQV